MSSSPAETIRLIRDVKIGVEGGRVPMSSSPAETIRLIRDGKIWV